MIKLFFEECEECRVRLDHMHRKDPMLCEGCLSFHYRRNLIKILLSIKGIRISK